MPIDCMKTEQGQIINVRTTMTCISSYVWGDELLSKLVPQSPRKSPFPPASSLFALPPPLGPPRPAHARPRKGQLRRGGRCRSKAFAPWPHPLIRFHHQVSQAVAEEFASLRLAHPARCTRARRSATYRPVITTITGDLHVE